MSIKVMSQVWEHSTHQSGALLVLLALADFAGSDDGSRIFPGIERLAHKARLSRRQTEKILAELLKTGELVLVRRGGGRHEVSEYRIPMPLRAETGNPVVLTGFEKPRHPTHETPSPGAQNPVAGDGPRGMNRKRTVTRAGARGKSSFDPLGSLKPLQSERDKVSEAIEEIERPGGCAHRIMPTDPVKIARLQELRDRKRKIDARIDSIVSENAA